MCTCICTCICTCTRAYAHHIFGLSPQPQKIGRPALFLAFYYKICFKFTKNGEHESDRASQAKLRLPIPIQARPSETNQTHLIKSLANPSKTKSHSKATQSKGKLESEANKQNKAKLSKPKKVKQAKQSKKSEANSVMQRRAK